MVDQLTLFGEPLGVVAVPDEDLCDVCRQRTARYLCDSLSPEQMRNFRDPDGDLKTCDRKLCNERRVCDGALHICCRSGKGKGCYQEAIDCCLQHAGMMKVRRLRKQPREK